MSGGLPPAGWYEDPRGEADLRWWDGTSWTAHTAARPQSAPAPPVTAASPPSAALPPAPAPGDAPPPAAPSPAQAKPRVRPPVAPGEQPSIEIGGRVRPLAGWWSRAVAFVIDSVIKFAFLLPFIAVAVVVAMGIDWQSVDVEKLQEGKTVDGRVPGLTLAETAQLGAAFLVVIAGWLLVEFTYQPLTMARKGENNGRTWGMQAMGIRVLRDSGEPMNYGAAVVRETLVMGFLYNLIGVIGNAVTVVGGSVAVLVFYLWPLWDAENRAVQDFICSTHVVAD